MLKALSWFKALKSHTLGVRLKQTNLILHSHAKAIISLSFGFEFILLIWDSKLLLSLSTYKSIILPNIIYTLFAMHSFLTAEILFQITEMLILATSFFHNLSGEHAPYRLPPPTLDRWCP